ncbi:MAG: hypothetical protein EBT71_00665 [Alphaproteobacteria bacterium]|nr:hypothetical protein [Alphaproteobacteria bacterium]
MALIERFEKDDLQRHKVQAPVHRACWSLFQQGGNTFLYIRTFGSEERENPEKPSQQFQLGPEAIAQLKEILEGIE